MILAAVSSADNFARRLASNAGAEPCASAAGSRGASCRGRRGAAGSTGAPPKDSRAARAVPRPREATCRRHAPGGNAGGGPAAAPSFSSAAGAAGGGGVVWLIAFCGSSPSCPRASSATCSCCLGTCSVAAVVVVVVDGAASSMDLASRTAAGGRAAVCGSLPPRSASASSSSSSAGCSLAACSVAVVVVGGAASSVDLASTEAAGERADFFASSPPRSASASPPAGCCPGKNCRACPRPSAVTMQRCARGAPGGCCCCLDEASEPAERRPPKGSGAGSCSGASRGGGPRREPPSGVLPPPSSSSGPAGLVSFLSGHRARSPAPRNRVVLPRPDRVSLPPSVVSSPPSAPSSSRRDAPPPTWLDAGGASFELSASAAPPWSFRALVSCSRCCCCCSFGGGAAAVVSSFCMPANWLETSVAAESRVPVSCSRCCSFGDGDAMPTDWLEVSGAAELSALRPSRAPISRGAPNSEPWCLRARICSSRWSISVRDAAQCASHCGAPAASLQVASASATNASTDDSPAAGSCLSPSPPSLSARASLRDATVASSQSVTAGRNARVSLAATTVADSLSKAAESDSTDAPAPPPPPASFRDRFSRHSWSQTSGAPRWSAASCCLPEKLGGRVPSGLLSGAGETVAGSRGTGPRRYCLRRSTTVAPFLRPALAAGRWSSRSLNTRFSCAGDAAHRTLFTTPSSAAG
ncbi:hypothetical protein DIPPA_01925 [Diplonema papillatum]|nr:hypothetical protein DIPPA_01925 [Diplonema papillatum]